MQPNKKHENDLQPLFAAGRATSVTKGDSESAENSAIKKEATRLIKEGAAFEKSKARWQKNLMKAALVVAGISVVLNLVLGGALIVLMPLKSVEPYLLVVDRQGGSVNIEQPLSKPLPTYGQVVDSHFLGIYVTARESYDWGLAQRNYDTVKAFSVTKGSVWNEYNTFIRSPKSPLTILADKSRVVVDITSEPLIDKKTNTAVVRFTKTVLGADGQPSASIPKTFWIATVGYSYPNPKLKPQERRFNPLGMKIPSYQVVQETGAR